MTPELLDHELDALLLDADPVDVVGLREVARTGAANVTRDAIKTQVIPLPRARRRRPLVALAVAAVAAVATPLAFAVLAPSSPQSAYAAQVVAFAENAPRLLAHAPGWKVVDLNQSYEDTGDETFGSGGRTLEVDWDTPADSFDAQPDDLIDRGVTTVDGVRAVYGHYPTPVLPVPPGVRYFGTQPLQGYEYNAVWSIGGMGLSARGDFADQASFLAVVTSLYRVDVTTWLDAMPAGVVTPAGRKVTVEKMLADIPQPPGFDPTQLSRDTLLLDRYQLGAHVTSAVGCGWVYLWFHGTARQKGQAAAAMASSHHWAILLEMERSGDDPLSFWEIADYMNGKPLGGVTADETAEEIAKNHVDCRY